LAAALSPGTVQIRRSGEVPVLFHRVTLAGSPDALRWPDVCACCGAASAERLPVTRVFNRDWRFSPAARSADAFRIISVRTLAVPFCAACVSRHRQEVRSVGPLGVILSVFATAFVIPSILAVLAVVLYVFPALLGSGGALISVPATADRAAVFVMAAVGFGAVVWYQTRPRRVTPPTAVTSAFDFSDNLAGLFRPEYRVYGMENERFAQAFRDANHDRLHTAKRR
jgi:hypothetical protein